MTIIPPTVAEPATPDEDFARAEIYSLLAHLYYAPPEPALLAQLREAAEDDSGSMLASSWNALLASAREHDAVAIQAEYDALFGGVGKPDVYLFGSHYLGGFLNEKPLVRLRDDLAELGLTRDPSMPETEDHIAYLCEVMRFLITGAQAEGSNLDRQRAFFSTHLHPWVEDLCAAILQQPAARFYARLAEFSRDFNQIEAQGLDMLP